MDVFKLRDQLVEDYRHYAESFLAIKDERIREHVEHDLDDGLLWPDPALQLNPAFESGGQIDELVAKGLLHSECSRIFRIGKRDEPGSAGEPLRLHRHQAEAVRAAHAAKNYVLLRGIGGLVVEGPGAFDSRFGPSRVRRIRETAALAVRSE